MSHLGSCALPLLILAFGAIVAGKRFSMFIGSQAHWQGILLLTYLHPLGASLLSKSLYHYFIIGCFDGLSIV